MQVKWLGVANKAAILLATLFCLNGPIIAPASHAEDGVTKLHALTFLDKPKYGPDFAHLDYVNPDAPKGGSVTYAGIGTFDNFNPYIIKGNAGALPGVFETLTTSPDDDSMSEYGLIAESMEQPADRSWITFNLRPQARWHDGKPITAEDVVFSFEALRDKGDPHYRTYYADVTKVEALDPHRVKFTFKSNTNRELPIILGQLPVLPKHFWQGRNFEEPLTDFPLGSGPYKLTHVDMGRSITVERVPDYWGKDLPINIGTNNFDTIRYDYYRDPSIAFEAFKSGAVDFRRENSSKNWATAYDIPQVKSGLIKKEVMPDDNPFGFQGFGFNLRRSLFADRRVREAISQALDFEWSNKTLFYGLYTRNRSYFDNSELAATGLPSPDELMLLEPFRGKIPDEVFTTEYQPPQTDGSGDARANLDRAATLLDQAGWKVVNGKRQRDGKDFAFEILLDSPLFERIAQPFVQNLKRLGIEARIRTVDAAQYENRVRTYDYDMMVVRIGQSLSPGNEQSDFWSSKNADEPGGSNYMGVKDPAVDVMVDKIINAPTRKDLVTATHALDRLLQWGFYAVPHFTNRTFWIASWDKFGRPDKLPSPAYSIGQGAWWIDPQKLALVQQRKASVIAAATAPAVPDTNPPANGTSSPATTAAAPVVAGNRGTTPIYGALIGLVIGFALGRVGRRK
jgi:microcin C transport system substrate-binding protein